jgi:hypothetical protein
LEYNLYSANGNLLLETWGCMHLTLGEDAILKWDGYRGKLIWEDDDFSCDVKKLINTR